MVTQFEREDLVKNLPDAYCKTADSNNSKLLTIEKDALSKVREAIAEINTSLDLAQASGKTLDLYGDLYGVLRGDKTDEQYRLAIRQKIAVYLCKGDYNSLIDVLAFAIGSPVTAFHLEDADISGVVDVKKFPYDNLQAAGISVAQAGQMLQSLLPAGVRYSGFHLTHDIKDADLTTACAVTHSESYVIDAACRFSEAIETEQVGAASAVTHNENHNLTTMEVQT